MEDDESDWNISFAESNDTSFGNYSIPSHDSTVLVMTLWHKLLWAFLFAIMVICATGGNLIVIWIVLFNKRMRTVTNYFLVNLSIADACVSTFNVIFNALYMIVQHWPFGLLYCKISQFISVLCIAASVFTLMAISIDRYVENIIKSCSLFFL